MKKNNIKNSFKQQLTILKGELQLNFPIWLIQIIITLAVMLMMLALCFLAVNKDGIINYSFPQLSSASNLFQFLFQNFLIACCNIFALIYMIKSLSYLYNKRKLDMYSSMPITRRTFFNGKILSSFVMSIMSFVVFQGIAFIIGISTGATFECNEIAYAVLFIFNVLFVICFYSFCAICSKSSWNAVISMFIIEILLPFAVNLLNSFLCAFFYGVNPFYISELKLLNIFAIPNNADYIFILYWIILGVLLLCASNLFIGKRNPENSKSSFVFPVLEYLIKILISFTSGVLLGLVMGSLGGKNGLLTFIVGFLIASIPMYIVIHIIYNRGFQHLFKSCIALGILIAVSIAGFWICDANPMNFKNTVPDSADIESVGLIDTGNVFMDITPQLIIGSTSDFNDEETINNIVKLHQETIDMSGNMATSEKCIRVFSNMITDYLRKSLPLEYYNTDGYIISYKYKNGGESTYFYANEYDEDLLSSIITAYNYTNRDYYSNDEITEILAEIEISQTYLEKYKPLYTFPAEQCDTFSVIPLVNTQYDDYDSDESYYDEDADPDITVAGSDEYYDFINSVPMYNAYKWTTDYNGNTKEKANFQNKLENIYKALKKDLTNDKNRNNHCKPYIGSIFTYGYLPEDIAASLYLEKADEDVKFAVTFGYGYNDYGSECAYDVYYIPSSYTNTINALAEMKIINPETYSVRDSLY